MLTRLERAELQRRVSKNAEEPKMWTGPCYCVGDRVGAVGYLTEELSYYNTEVSGCAVLCCRRFSFRLGFGGGGGGVTRPSGRCSLLWYLAQWCSVSLYKLVCVIDRASLNGFIKSL